MTSENSGMATEKPAAERITVGLIPKVAGELNELVRTTGMSRTDLVNRALTLSAFVNEQLAAGKDLLVRDNHTGEIERIRLL